VETRRPRTTCTSCGDVFCDACCSSKAVVPQRRIYTPATVCDVCVGDGRHIFDDNLSSVMVPSLLYLPAWHCTQCKTGCNLQWRASSLETDKLHYLASAQACFRSLSPAYHTSIDHRAVADEYVIVDS
jgi:hypothetical protein